MLLGGESILNYNDEKLHTYKKVHRHTPDPEVVRYRLSPCAVLIIVIKGIKLAIINECHSLTSDTYHCSLKSSVANLGCTVRVLSEVVSSQDKTDAVFCKFEKENINSQ